VNGNTKLILRSSHSSNKNKSKHGALLQQLRKGDRVAIYGGGHEHNMAAHFSAFGVFMIR
jgi:hypothetical protein